MANKKRLKIGDLRSSDAVLRDQLKDEEFRKEWNRTALARAVALRILRYREANGLSQTDLARLLGLQQPAIARLEAGEKNPTWETISRLAQVLRIEFMVNITPTRRRHLVAKDLRREADVVEMSDDGTLLVAVR